jgi:hypothetical protein
MLDEKCIITDWIVQSLASRGLFDGCGIYRAEPPGETNDDGHPGTRKGCACKSPITKILVWWIKAVQCTYPLLFFAASSSQGQGLLSFITWLVLDCLYHLVFFQFFPGLRVRGTGMRCCREGYSHVGAKRTKSCLWNLSWITVKGQFHWSQWVFWTAWLLEMVGWTWLSM